MEAQKSFKVEFLKEEEALELFHKKVGEETINSHPRIKVLAKEMAAKCKGLPLALIVVGSAMAGVESIEAWEGSINRLTSSSWIGPDLERQVFSVLKLSYDRLPDNTHKKCFLYCTSYPDDHEIRASDIIDKWIGEGLLCKDMTRSVYDIRNDGHSIIAKLKLCCLLESVEDDIVVGRSFKMHDMIRDMALLLARDQDKSIKKVLAQGEVVTLSHDDVETWKIVERISIIAQQDTRLVPPITCPNLVTLLLSCSSVDLENIKYMSKLKVLRLSARNVCGLEQIGELGLLEYLSLNLDALEYPMELENLKNLKVLNLFFIRSNIISILSKVISSLQQLRVLRVHSHFSLVGREDDRKVEGEFLKEVECLPYIEELNVEIATKNGLNKLFESNKLQSCMCAFRVDGLIDTIIEMHLLLACISKMKHLRQFAMWNLTSAVEDSRIYDTTYSLTMLQSVAIGFCYSLTHVTWLKYAPLLQLLVIYHCNSIEQVIKEDEIVDSSSIFSSLVNLRLYGMLKLESIHKTALSFPCLKAIRIQGCSNLKKLPLYSYSAKHKLRLISGEEYWWNNLEWDDPSAKHHFQSIFQPSTWLDIYSLNFADADRASGLDFSFD